MNIEEKANYIGLLKEKVKSLKAEIIDKELEVIAFMKDEDIDNYDSSLCKVSYIKGSEQFRVDTKMLKEMFTEAQLKPAMKLSTRKDSIRIIMKKE